MLERMVAYDLLARRPRLRALLRPVRIRPECEMGESHPQRGRHRSGAADGTTTLSVTLSEPLQQSEPNVIPFALDYRLNGSALGPTHSWARPA